MGLMAVGRGEQVLEGHSKDKGFHGKNKGKPGEVLGRGVP